jgi:MYXO-CTERM domain-containing protein
MTHRTAWLIAAALLVTTEARADVLGAIDDAYARGEIGEAERQAHRVTAVRAPERLPARWQGQAPTPARCHAPVLLEAFQSLRTMPEPQRSELPIQLGPPQEFPYYVQTGAPFPVIVFYQDMALQGKAERVLAAMITSYQREVVDWGFWPPHIEPGQPGYFVFLANAGGAAGYTAPYAENPDTPHTDAYTYIFVEPSLSLTQIDSTVAHEFNHACQAAMDILELRSFFENTASYIEIPVFPDAAPLAAAVFPYFQNRPYLPLEYRVPDGPTDGYEYGGALWPLFLAHAYGGGDPSFVRQIWEGTVQNGFDNEPDYFDAIEQHVPGGIGAAARLFGEHRFHVGMQDDGLHLPSAGEWQGAEPWVTADAFPNQLPILDQAPALPDTLPQPNGCNYIRFTPEPASPPVRFSFQGDPGADWHVAVLGHGEGESLAVDVAVDALGAGVATIDASGLERLALMVCHASPPGYDPDDQAWQSAAYTYGIEYDVPTPLVSSITPPAIAVGTEGAAVVVTGTGFYGLPQLMVSGGLVNVYGVELVSDTELHALVTVASDAALGGRDVTVTNPGGSSSTTPGVLSIVEAESTAPVDDVVGEEGCACRAAAGPKSAAWPWLVALAAGLVRRRLRCKG